MKNYYLKPYWVFWLALLCLCQTVNAQTFTHPGGLHTLEDLNRMKEKVAAGESPWIEGWNALISDWKSSATYGMTDGARENANHRQNMNRDAQAAYLNALRWYISGDVAHAEKAISIYNAYASKVNQVPSGGNTDILGLGGIGFTAMAAGAEIMRLYDGWAAEDFEKFKFMMKEYFYPVTHDFLTNHKGACPTYFWANWDLNNISAMIAIGILVDDQNIFNEGVEYFKNGIGSGSIINAVPFVQGNFGQWQESGRDQSHAMLGIGLMANICQLAWNQGVDLYGYDDNRFLKGAEFVARTGALSLEAPFFEEYNSCANRRHRWVAINALGRYFDQPVWEIVYNHYVVGQGLEAPHVEAMAQIMRLAGSTNDQLGHGTLTYTLDGNQSPVDFAAPPGQLTGLNAYEGIGRVQLRWNAPESMDAMGYIVKRSTTPGGPYEELSRGGSSTFPGYTDYNVVNGTTYYYVVAALNKAGDGPDSEEIAATPVEAGTVLPAGWTRTDIGALQIEGEAVFAEVNTGHTFITRGAGIVGRTSDALGFTYGIASGDVTLTARVTEFGGLQKTGIMIRESLDPDAKTVLMKIGDAGWRVAEMGARTETGANMEWIGGNRYTWSPEIWFRISRTGNTFTVYESNNKDVWFEVGSRTIEMGEDVYVGLFNSSGNTTSWNSTRYDHVAVVASGTAVPDSPTGLTAVAGNMQDTLSWNSVSGASSYTLKRATESGGPYTTIATNLNDTSYVDTGLENGTTYYYVVTAANLAGESQNSSEIGIAPVLMLPPVPEEVVAASVSATQIELSWEASLSAESYNIKRSETDGGPYTTIASTATTMYSDTGLVASTAYYYVVTAVNAIGETGNSSQARAIPGAANYWKFDETEGSDAADSWGTGHATLSSSATFTEGLLGNAVSLNGSNGYVTLPEGIVSSLTDFSISVWVKPDEIKTWARVFDFGSGTDNNMFLTVNANTNVVRYAIRTPSVGYIEVNSSGSISTDRWNHIAITQTGTTVILYLDGVEAGSNTNMTLNPSSLGNTPQNWIGKSQWPDPLLAGRVDDFRIYSRALDAAEVDSLYNEPVFPPVAPTSLLASPGDNKITLTWTEAQGATSYTVYRSDVSGGPYAQIDSSSTNGYTDTEVLNDSIYYYVVTSTTSLGESAYSEEISSAPNGGRLAYLKFDETDGTVAADFWGANNGTLSSGATFTEGHIDNAANLDGSSGHVALPAGIVNQLTDFSITTWVKLDRVDNWARVFDFGSGTNTYMFLTPRNGGSGRLRYAIKNGGGEQQINTNSALTTGRWYHVAVTQTGTTAILYLDGAEVGRNTNMTLNPSSLGNTTQNWIGKSQWPDPLLAGQVDDFRIYSEALSASKIAEMAFAYLPPAAPKNLSAVAGNNEVALNWTAVLGGTNYNIKRATAIEGPFEMIANAADTSYIDTTAVNCEKYFYTVTTLNTVGESTESLPASPWLGTKLSGTLIGTEGSGGNNLDRTKEAAVDGDLGTYFDAPTNTAWVGYDLGADGVSVITRIRYAPRPDAAHRMIGGHFQGANSPDFSDAETFAGVGARPDSWVMTEQHVANGKPYRYVRFLSPNGYGSVAELEFYGLAGQLPVFSSDSIAVGTYDSVFHYSTVASNMPEEFIAAGLPEGLSMDTCTGVISGIPKEAGKFSVAITATNYVGSATDTVKLVIKKNQTISFSAIPSKYIGDADFELAAVATSGLPISYSSSDTTVATIVNGNMLHINEVGTCIITASQAGDSIHYPAEDVSQSFSVVPLNFVVMHKDGDGGKVSNNSIKPQLQIVNNDSMGIPYSELTVRYWFTPENYAGINNWIDSAEMGEENIGMQYIGLDQPHQNAFGYIEYSFDASSDTLFAGGNSGNIQSRFSNQDWTDLDETNDYSYQPNSSFTENENVTLYRNGYLIWGEEPSEVTSSIDLKVHAFNQKDQNEVKLKLEIANEGNVPVSYGDIKVRYWFTKEGTDNMIDVVDYAELGSLNLDGQFFAMEEEGDQADHYYELGFSPELGQCYPLSTTGEIQLRFHEADWTSMDQSNDHSYLQGNQYAINEHITVYYLGELVFGTEPEIGMVTSAESSEVAAEQEPIQVVFYPNPTEGMLHYKANFIGENGAELSAINDKGKVMIVKQINSNEGSVDLSSLKTGVYVMQIFDGVNLIREKVIKK